MAHEVYADSENGLKVERMEVSSQGELQNVVNHIKARHYILDANNTHTQHTEKKIGEILRYVQAGRHKVYRVVDGGGSTQSLYCLIESDMWITPLSGEPTVESAKTMIRYVIDAMNTVPQIVITHTRDIRPHEYEENIIGIASDAERDFLEGHTVYNILRSQI